MAVRMKTKGNVSGNRRVKSDIKTDSATQHNDVDQKAVEQETLPAAKGNARALIKAEINSQPQDVIKDNIEKLKELQDEIRKNLDTFLDVVIYLNTIQEEKLWMYKLDEKGNPLYTTFEQFISSEFDIKRSYYSRLNAAARAYRLLEEKVGKDEIKKYPKTCAIFYELSRADENKYMDIIKKATGNSSEGIKQLKANDIKKIIRDEKLNTSKASKKEADPKRQLEISLGILKRLNTPDVSVLDSKFFDNDKESVKTIIDNMKRLIEQLEKKQR